MNDRQAKHIALRAVRLQPEVKAVLFAELTAEMSKLPLASLSAREVAEQMMEMCRKVVKRLKSLGFEISWDLAGKYWVEWLKS